jgi:hypothetical protein
MNKSDNKESLRIAPPKQSDLGAPEDALSKKNRPLAISDVVQGRILYLPP